MGTESLGDNRAASQPSPNESMVGSVLHNINPIDFLKGCYQGAVQKPVDAIKQLCGSKPAEPQAQRERTLAAKAGELVGEVVDFTILSAATHGALKPVLGAAVDGVSGTAIKMFATGAVDGGLLTKSDESKGLLRGRLESAIITGSTFAIMGGTKKALDSSKDFGSTTFLSRSRNSVIAGSISGAVSANENAYVRDGRLATGEETAVAAGRFALFSAGMDVLQLGAKRVSESDVFAKAHAPESPRLPLTPENNPVLAFDRHFVRFVDDVQAVDRQGTTGNTAFYALAKTKAAFVERLLGVWHGTTDSPGMAAYSDAELAAATPPGANYSVERIAQIRDALNSPLNAGPGVGVSELDGKMAKLAPVDISKDPEKYELFSGLHDGAQNYFGFDIAALNEKLGLGATNEAISRHGATPLEWMPFEPSSNLTNLFHATNSRAIGPILEQRSVLSASEVRSRGIEQKTGESAGQDIAHQEVSMTRSFPTAFLYHRAGPVHLIDYPVVFGISRDVMSQAKPAMFTEPGELLIERLKLGSSWREWLGLRKPQVTHMFVPDNQVSSVEQAVNSHRLRGLSVVGFSKIDTPVWNDPQPMVEQLTAGLGFD
ncbi:MAG TPA: hypothetical protein V6C97_26300 [Oculatellaceae cyanobacterium]